MWATLLGLSLLAGLTAFLGRVVARVARVKWLDRSHPDVLPLQAALGTAVLTCLCATASHAGLGQSRAIWPVAGICGVLAVWAARRRAPSFTPSGGRLSRWLPLTIAIGAAVIAGLLPVVWLGSFNTINDAFYYNTTADWLVSRGVSQIAPRDSMHPALAIVPEVQQTGIRLGSTYLQAFVAAALGISYSLFVFYAVSCWGFILLAANVFCLGRQVFRLSPWLCTAAVCTMVCIPAGNAQALQAGFQAQLYGVSAIIAILCATARLLDHRSWTRGGCIVLGALLAWLTSSYSELLPLAGVVLLVWLAITARRAVIHRDKGAWVRAVAVVAVSSVLLSNLEIARAVAALPMQLRSDAGLHIDVGHAAWPALFAGTTVYPTLKGLNAYVYPVALLVLSVVLLALSVLGLLRCKSRPRLWMTRAAFLVLSLMAVHFALFARDPWTHDTLHTWALYKTSQWLHPLIITSAWAAVSRFLRGRRAPQVAAVVAMLLVCAGLPIQYRYADMCSFQRMSGFAGSDRPLAELERLGRNMSGIAGQQVYVVTRPHLTNARFVELLGYFTIHNRAAGLWSGCTYIYQPPVKWMRPELTDVVPANRPLTLLCHRPLFWIAGARDFGCQVEAVTVSEEPILCQVANANGLEWSPEGQPFVWIGEPATTLVIFAPRVGRLHLSFESRPGPELESSQGHIEIRIRRATRAATIDFGPRGSSQTVSLDFPVARGVNEITLRCTDAPAGHQRPESDPRSLMLSFSAPQLSYN